MSDTVVAMFIDRPCTVTGRMRTRAFYCEGKLSRLGGVGVCGVVLGGEVTGQCLRLWIVLGKLSWLGGVGVCGVKKDQGQSIKDNPPSSIKTANEP